MKSIDGTKKFELKDNGQTTPSIECPSVALDVRTVEPANYFILAWKKMGDLQFELLLILVFGAVCFGMGFCIQDFQESEADAFLIEKVQEYKAEVDVCEMKCSARVHDCEVMLNKDNPKKGYVSYQELIE